MVPRVIVDVSFVSSRESGRFKPFLSKKSSDMLRKFNKNVASIFYDQNYRLSILFFRLNQLFFRDPDGQYIPNPAPKLSRTPPFADQGSQPIIGGHTREVLIESGFTFAEVDHFLSIGAAVDRSKKSRL